MTLKHYTLSVLALLVFSITGCQKSRDQKINDFVNDYNTSAAMMSNQIISSTSAEAMPDKSIRIVFKSTMPQNDGNKKLYEQLMPTMATEMVKRIPESQDLIDDGVKIHFAFLATDDSELAAMTVDKKQMDAKPAPKRAVKRGNHLSPQLQDVLAMLGQSLPIEDKAAGTKITAIDVNEKMELVYTVEVTDELAEALKNPQARQMMKEEMLRDPVIQKMLPGMRKFDVSTIKYVYTDKKGQLINETVITANDLK